MGQARLRGEGKWPEGTCYFNRLDPDEFKRADCAFPQPLPIGLGITVWAFFGLSYAAVKRVPMSSAVMHRDRRELEALARAHRVPWTERMLKLFGIVEDLWIPYENKRIKDEQDRHKAEEPLRRGGRGKRR